MLNVRIPSAEVVVLTAPVACGLGSKRTLGRAEGLQRIFRSKLSLVETLPASILQLSTTRTDTVTVALRLSAAAKRESANSVTKKTIAAPTRIHRRGLPRSRSGWLRHLLLTPIGRAESVPAIHESQVARFLWFHAAHAEIIVGWPAREEAMGSRLADGHIARQKSTSMRMVSV